MDQPKCRTCGERHRVGPCPRFNTAASIASRQSSKSLRPPPGKKPVVKDGSKVGRANELPTQGGTVPTVTPSATAPHRLETAKAGINVPDGGKKFDRAAYQREYMRQYMRKRRQEQGK